MAQSSVLLFEAYRHYSPQRVSKVEPSQFGLTVCLVGESVELNAQVRTDGSLTLLALFFSSIDRSFTVFFLQQFVCADDG